MKVSSQECVDPSCSPATEDRNDPSARPIERLLRKLKICVSSPPIPQPGDDRSASPQHSKVRSADDCDKRYVSRAKDCAICNSSQLSAAQDRIRISLFSVRKWINQGECGGKVPELTQIRLEDSLVDGGNGEALTKLYTNDNESSRELSKLFEEDPDARSGVFTSLLAIENY